jgi:Heterokaryon incompatibility protein (HET)
MPIYSDLGLKPYPHQTRLIHLKKGSWYDTIKCELEVVGLGERLGFEAVSYEWGEEMALDPIYLKPKGFPDDRYTEHEVRANLFSALQNFRRGDSDRTIWVDAISINQSYIEERNQQVSLMTEIYQDCSGVLIWLGGDTTTLGPLAQEQEPCEWTTSFGLEEGDIRNRNDDLAQVKNFNRKFRTYYNRPKALRTDVDQDFEMGAICLLYVLAQDDPNAHLTDPKLQFFQVDLSRQNVTQALHAMMSRGWWGRQWVIQETVLALKAQVHFGRFAFSWEMLTRAAKHYNKHRNAQCCSSEYVKLPTSVLENLNHFARTVLDIGTWREVWWGHDRPRIELLSLLWQFRQRSTTNPRDKVYALLPLVNDWGRQKPIDPHYGWTESAVYHDVTQKLLNVHGNLLPLMGNAEKSGSYALPSWVPDWTVPPDEYEAERLDRAQMYSASGKPVGRRSMFRVLGENGEYLELHGKRHGVVGREEAIGPVMPNNEDPTALDVFRAWEGLARIDGDQSAKYDPDGSFRHEAWWRTLCMDTVYKGKEFDDDNLPLHRKDYERTGDHYGEGYISWREESPPQTTGTNTPLPRPTRMFTVRQLSTTDEDLTTLPTQTAAAVPAQMLERDEAIATDRAIASATTSRRFFITDNEFMGLGPKTMRAGDEVFVLAGGTTPFLLRPVGKRNIPRVDGAKECFELVGDCYVHGIMDGEAMPKTDGELPKLYLV